MSISHAQYAEMLARTSKNAVRTAQPIEPVKRESTLHEQIIEFCDKQWPRWKYRHARMDKATTEECGVEDFTIFMPGGKTLHVECKARGKKPSPAQLIWKKELEMLGHTVHIIYSLEDFKALIT